MGGLFRIQVMQSATLWTSTKAGAPFDSGRQHEPVHVVMLLARGVRGRCLCGPLFPQGLMLGSMPSARLGEQLTWR